MCIRLYLYNCHIFELGLNSKMNIKSMRWGILLYAICTLMLIAVVHQKLKAGVRAHITHPTTAAAENQSSLTSWSRSIEYLDTGIAQEQNSSGHGGPAVV